MRSRIWLALAFGSAVSAANALDHLLITEFVVTPTAGEFIEIVNPTASPIDLSNYYLTDAVASNDNRYIDLVDGSVATSSSDFLARFPAGATIGAGSFAVISMHDDADFTGEYGTLPDYEINDISGGTDGIADMVDPGGLIGGSAGLSNSGEMIVLFYWDGTTDLVADVDYAVWGDLVEAVDKTGFSKDGPDADAIATPYLDDTPVASQAPVDPNGSAGQPHDFGFSAARAFPFAESAETSSGGNGITGHDETSEDLSIAGNWSVHAAPSPGTIDTDAPPTISNLAYAPCIPEAFETVTVAADVVDQNIDEVSLLMSLDGGVVFDTTAMVNTVGDTYSGDLTPLPAGPTVTFKVLATDLGGNSADTWLYDYVVETFTDISTIQSDTTSGGDSNYDGSAVNVAGYVTTASGSLSDSYFYLAETATAAPWEGIKVFAPSGPAVVAEGDWVEVGGVVDEYYGETEVLAAEDSEDAHDCVMVLTSTAVDVKPLMVPSTAINDEALEGVVVTVNDAVAADTMNGFGEWFIDDGSGSAMVKSNFGISYFPVIGDAVDVTGPVGYAFGSFRIQARDDADLDEVAFNIEIVQHDDIVGPGDTWSEYVTITNGSAATVAFDAVDLEYVGPPTGSYPFFSGSASFPSSFAYSTLATVPIPGFVPPTTFETSTVISSGGAPIAAADATVVATATGARVSVPTSGAGTPARKITGGGTISWDVTVANTGGVGQTLSALTAHVERFSHAANDWVSDEDVTVFSGSEVLAPGGSSTYPASTTLLGSEFGGRYRVRHTATFVSGIDSQTALFHFRNDS